MCHLYCINTTEEKDELNLITLAQQYSDDDKVREFTRRRQSRKIKKDK